MMRWDGGNSERREARLQLIIADRQPLVAAALAALVSSWGHGVALVTTRIAELESRAAAGGIDAIIADINLAARWPFGVAMIFTAPDAGQPGLAAAIDAGADGLVRKDEAAECLAHCLAAVALGGRWLDRDAVAAAAEQRQARAGAASLTRREADVARLVAGGQRNRAIALRLGIAEGTVKMHLHNVYAKLGLESRTQLAMDERLRALA